MASGRAFTLMEALVASSLLAIIVLAITQTVTSGQAVTFEALHQQRASALAEALMEEIVSLPYDDPAGQQRLGPEASETSRTLYDSANDFDGWSESPGQLADAVDNLYPAAYQRFSRSVTAQYTTMQVSDLGGEIAGLSINITVSDDRGMIWQLQRFIPEPAP